MSFLKKLLDGIEVKWQPLSEITLRTNNIKWRDTTDSYRYIDLTSVDIETKKIIETSVVTSNNAPSRAQKLIEKDDVIFATTRPTQMRYCLIDEEYDGEVASTGYCVLRAKKEVILPKWILHLISSSEFKGYLEENQSGSAYPAISDAKLKEFKIPLPCPDNPQKSLEIQTEIVRILDTFSAMTAELTAELSTRKKQYNYYRDQLLSFKDGEVEWSALGDIGAFTYGYAAKAQDFGDARFVRITDINANGKLILEEAKYVDISDENEKYLLNKNDLLMARTGATFGKTMIFEEDYPAIYAGFLIKLSLDEKIVNPKYYWHFAQSDLFWDQANKLVSGGGQPQFNANALKQVKMPLPYPQDNNKSLIEQARIVSILDKFDAITSSIREGLPREIELRQQQYEYYRDLLFSFPKSEEIEA
ncbi:MAG: type I restriction endonuclease subunit S [Pseudomonadales bacterium RIFCSPHIGHO2_12_FULL_40_16]|uniref:restriction endonuclease subunit S n=1 Tax=Acinetobacter bereziniae TaxID=106648 RepID=UPI000679B30F|nr:restriction endonuclease subunit S [Acinetobacter bereziniae]OHC25197.1 MAG: type I restriction endonuclease subunit S [Pseudomonadales bacterium RIFCSPHIGHO2_12_FULL_40_16]